MAKKNASVIGAELPVSVVVREKSTPTYRMEKTVSVLILVHQQYQCGGVDQGEFTFHIVLEGPALDERGFVLDNGALTAGKIAKYITGNIDGDNMVVGSCEHMAGSVVAYLLSANGNLSYAKVTVDNKHTTGGTISVEWHAGQSRPATMRRATPAEIRAAAQYVEDTPYSERASC